MRRRALAIWSPNGANTLGQVFVFFILTVAAAEAAIGLAILVVLFRNTRSINVEELDPEPFLDELGKMGLPTKVKITTPKNGKPSKDGMPVSATKSNSIRKHAVW